MRIGDRVSTVSTEPVLDGVTGTIVGERPGDDGPVYCVHMDRSWAELGSINPGFQGHLMWAEPSALSLDVSAGEHRP